MSLSLEKLQKSIDAAQTELDSLNDLGPDAKAGTKYKHSKEIRKHLQDIKVEAQALREASKK